jgi:F-type H+-transporting ATPase subunit gamma
MPSTRDIRRRIKSVKNTAQITKAMQMVAASKMRKAQASALAGRAFQDVLERVLAALKGRVDPSAHELLAVREIQKELVFVVATDKGLCGALNTNLFREISELDSAKTVFMASGRKAVQYLSRTRRTLLADFELKDQVAFSEVRPIRNFIIEKFLSKEVDRVRLLYAHFVNTLTQKPTFKTLLPISPEELGISGAEAQTEYLFEPTTDAVLRSILPQYIGFQVYQAILDARASEHSARMVAMKTATDNAQQLVKDLTLEYNKVRQASITTEILEIATAQMALG